MSGAAMAISAAGVGEDGVSGDSRAGEHLGLGQLDMDDNGGVNGHDNAARGQRRTRVSRWRGRGSVGHGAGEQGREAGGEWMCPRGSGRDVEVVPANRAARGGSRAMGSCVARAGAGIEHLAACLAEPSSSLERWLGWAGRWAC